MNNLRNAVAEELSKCEEHYPLQSRQMNSKRANINILEQ